MAVATQVGEADLLVAIPAVEVVHRCSHREEAAAADGFSDSLQGPPENKEMDNK